jgi:hypothetical protein
MVGLGCFLALAHMESQDRTLDHHGVHTRATIIQVRKEPRNTFYLLRFDPSAQAPADTWTKDVNGTVGTEVDVVYDPADPGGVAGTAALSSHEWILPLVLVPAGLAALAMAWAVGRTGRR